MNPPHETATAIVADNCPCCGPEMAQRLAGAITSALQAQSTEDELRARETRRRLHKELAEMRERLARINGGAA